MTYAEALALVDGTLVTGVQPCDAVEYTWVRNHEDRIEPVAVGGRVLVKRPDVHPADQHKYLFVTANNLDLV
jgi:hypothetical protein